MMRFMEGKEASWGWIWNLGEEFLKMSVLKLSSVEFVVSRLVIDIVSKDTLFKHEPLGVSLPNPRSFCSKTFSTRYENETHVPQCCLTCPRDECVGKMFIRPDKFQQHFRKHKKIVEKTEE